MFCLSVGLVVCAGLQAGAQHAAPEASPAEQLRALKAEGALARRDFNRSDVPGTEEAVRKRAEERYRNARGRPGAPGINTGEGPPRRDRSARRSELGVRESWAAISASVRRNATPSATPSARR